MFGAQLHSAEEGGARVPQGQRAAGVGGRGRGAAVPQPRRAAAALGPRRALQRATEHFRRRTSRYPHYLNMMYNCYLYIRQTSDNGWKPAA